MVDMQMYPLLERVLIIGDILFPDIFEGEDFSAIRAWVRRIGEFPWA